MRFCDILRTLRKENNYTAKQLSSLIGYSVNIIYDWEKGRCEPPFNVLIKLSNIFGVSIDYLLGVDEELNVKAYEASPHLKTASIFYEASPHLKTASILLAKSPFSARFRAVFVWAVNFHIQKKIYNTTPARGSFSRARARV